MARVQKFLVVVMALGIVVVFAVFASGCETDEGPTGPTPISDDLFPLVAGHKITFSGYLRQPGADTNITATGAFYENRMTIGIFNSTTIPGLGTFTAVSDSNKVSPLPGPNGTWSVGALLFQKSVASGSADFSYVGSLGSFFRTFYPSTGPTGTTRSDTLRVFKLTDLASGIGLEYTAYDSTYNVTISGAATTARLQIVGIVNGTENITLGGTTFNAYKITISRRVYLGGSSVASSVGVTAELWVVKDLGPVKMVLGADDRSYGSYREFKSKNF
ncbi:MAG: hypothetical protein HY562_10945 [Ignavibacteriales bacterium]|nr:hypothetical protein [Ignavibacteriales bacterium]